MITIMIRVFFIYAILRLQLRSNVITFFIRIDTNYHKQFFIIILVVISVITFTIVITSTPTARGWTLDVRIRRM